MTRRLIIFVALVFASFVLLGTFSASRNAASGQSDPNARGRALYAEYCASCHGMDGKGAGPVASALKMMPTDLTTIAQREGGKFPDVKMQNYITGEVVVAAHGTREMPVWGNYFRRKMNDANVSKINIYALTKYIEAMQVK
jgi:mono/diheme cytochrome c family protein